MSDPAPLVIKARRTGERAERLSDRLVLLGELEWVVEGSPEQLVAIDEALVGVSEPLGTSLRLLNFRNAIGLFEVPGVGTIEVRSSKWTAEACERLLAELTEVASGLPFSAGLTAALPYERSVIAREDVLYHAFVYLRHTLLEQADASERLLPALQQVLHDPHRRFQQSTESVGLDVARRVDVPALVSLVAGRYPLTKLSEPSSLPLAVALRGHLPDRVDETQVQATYDTAENRFVKTFLDLARGVADGLRRVVRSRQPQDAFLRRLLMDCDAVERKLEPIVRHSLWRDVGPLVHLPASSTVLQRRRGYREIYRIYAKLGLATRVALPPHVVRDLLELKDVALLYELWSYFMLVRELKPLLGEPTLAEGPGVSPMEVMLRWDTKVEWAGRARLVYSPRFSPKTGNWKSYSVPLRPDIGLELFAGPNAGWHFFDAKFRVDRLVDLIPNEEEDIDADRAQERRGTFKLADLYKMHTYRDAIHAARSAWILYPGTETKFFLTGGHRLTSAAEFLHVSFDGVGALPLGPGRNNVEVNQALAALTGVAVLRLTGLFEGPSI